jgi:two-component system alkaline phosphatase synthesis response regulator PhoP
MAKVYIVEDDENIGELIAAALSAAGHETLLIPNADRLAERMRQESPQLLLLDIMLPGKDGWAILKSWKETAETAAIPVIILSAKGEELDKVRGLEMGAEDYITKPFGVLELQARVKTALRRMEDGGSILHLQDLSMDFDKKEVKKDGIPVKLTHQELELLEYLSRHAGFVVSRDRLLENVWGYDFSGETTRTVDFHVRSLRMKLGDSADNPKYIETVRGYGYRMKKE